MLLVKPVQIVTAQTLNHDTAIVSSHGLEIMAELESHIECFLVISQSIEHVIILMPDRGTLFQRDVSKHAGAQ